MLIYTPKYKGVERYTFASAVSESLESLLKGEKVILDNLELNIQDSIKRLLDYALQGITQKDTNQEARISYLLVTDILRGITEKPLTKKVDMIKEISGLVGLMQTLKYIKEINQEDRPAYEQLRKFLRKLGQKAFEYRFRGDDSEEDGFNQDFPY